MNKKQRDRLIELGLTYQELYIRLQNAEDFLFNDAQNFIKEESLAAIKSIEIKVIGIKEKLEILEKKMSELRMHCSHPVIVDGSNKYCAVCGEYMIDIPEDAYLVYDYDEILYIGQIPFLVFLENIDNYYVFDKDKSENLKLIHNIIKRTIDCPYFPEETITELSSNIKVRRLKK